MPHLSVPDIRWVDWQGLASLGFEGCVFDKDNTLCEPYALAVDPLLASALEDCQKAFAGRIILYSNSAGLDQYDPDGAEARLLERSFGMHVLQHREKKPAGGKVELEQYFRCPSSQLLMVGDRYFTDVLFGNMHGMATIRTAPLTLKGEPVTVGMSRRLEDCVTHHWAKQGVQAPPHSLLEAGAASYFLQKPRL